MVIKKAQTEYFKVGKGHDVWDYPMASKDVGISLQIIDGVTPDRGFWRNKACLECYYVISGEGKVTIEEKIYDVKEGDVIVLKQKQKHRLSGKNVKAIAITVPDWYEEQCEIVQ